MKYMIYKLFILSVNYEVWIINKLFMNNKNKYI